jgi:hypothetical protein
VCHNREWPTLEGTNLILVKLNTDSTKKVM